MMMIRKFARNLNDEKVMMLVVHDEDDEDNGLKIA
jgi:hypothetical protein